jgi:energy-coupling factor transporter transmembrane protein EcfT
MPINIFVLSVIIVSIISICFFKKKFWENRYLILGIIGGVALIATLTTNYFVRGHLQTKVKTAWENPIKFFNFPDSLFADSSLLIKDLKFDFNEQKGSNYLKKDTLHRQRTVAIVFYDRVKFRKIGYIKSNNKTDYDYLNINYIAPSTSDTIAYIAKKELRYVVKPNHWISDVTFPRKNVYTCIYIPPKEYALLPDSIIRKLPF